MSEYLPSINQDTEIKIHLEKNNVFLGLGAESCSFYRLIWIEDHNLYCHHFKVWILEISMQDINSYYCNQANAQNIENEPYLI